MPYPHFFEKTSSSITNMHRIVLGKAEERLPTMAKSLQNLPQDGVCCCTHSPKVPGRLSESGELGIGREGRGKCRQRARLQLAFAPCALRACFASTRSAQRVVPLLPGTPHLSTAACVKHAAKTGSGIKRHLHAEKMRVRAGVDCRRGGWWGCPHSHSSTLLGGVVSS